MTLYLEAKAGNPAAILSLSDRTRKLALELDPDAFHSRALRWLDGNSSATERPVGAPILLDDTQGDVAHHAAGYLGSMAYPVA